MRNDTQFSEMVSDFRERPRPKDKTKERKAPFVKNYAKASREAEYEIFNEEKPILIDWFFVIF